MSVLDYLAKNALRHASVDREATSPSSRTTAVWCFRLTANWSTS